jgi:aspartyl protease family protein
MKRCTIGLALAALAAASAAQTVTFNGRMGDKALLVIDHQPRAVAVGSTVQGVRLIAIEGDDARVESDGRQQLLHHGAPVSLGNMPSAAQGREVLLAAGPGGHFITDGRVNGKSASFMVDTGATSVAMSVADAERLGIDYTTGERAVVNTANGTAPAYRLLVNSIRIGEVEVFNVEAVVVPAALDHILLGNSFLRRFQMTRNNDVMRLEKKS